MDTPGKENPQILCLGDFTDDCANLDLESFTRAHGEAYLIHHGPIGKLKEPLDMRDTQAVEGGPGEAQLDPQGDFLVFPLRRRPGSKESGDLVRLGRSKDSDVVIPDASVSAVHAFFSRDKANQFFVADNDSMNGTFVNMKEVRVRGKGEPTVVKSASRLRFGSVVMTFLVAADFYNLVREFY